MSFLCLISHLLALIKTVSLCIPGGPNFLWVPSASLLPLRPQWGKPGILNTVYLAHSEKTTPGFLLEHSQRILQRSPPPRAARDVCWGFVCSLKLSLRTQLVPPFPLSRVIFIFEPGVCVLCLESAAPSLAAVRCWCLGSGMPCLAEEQRWVHQALWPFLCRLWFLQSQIWVFNGIGKCFCRGKGGLENGSLCKRQVSCKGAAKDKNFKDYRFCCKPHVLSSGIYDRQHTSLIFYRWLRLWEGWDTCLCTEGYSKRCRRGFLIPASHAALCWEGMLGRSVNPFCSSSSRAALSLLRGSVLRMPANPIPVHFQPTRPCFLPYLLFHFSLYPLVQ